jgi:SPASM domain peptide maturase of grasp-with-spasm system
MINKSYFILFSNCIPVKGYSESIIVDLQRGGLLEIPNLLYDIITNDLRKISMSKLKLIYSNEINDGIDAYFKYLEELEYGFFTNEPDLFPDLSLDFKLPFKIVSSIININDKSDYSITNVLSQIIDLGVQTVQIRFFKKINESQLLEIVKPFKKSRTKIVEIYLKDFNYDYIQFKHLLDNDSRISIFVHSSNNFKCIDLDNRIVFIKDEIEENAKEMYSKSLFISNIPFFCESQSFNVGLNKKVCIDSKGNIKNYVNHKLSFVNINNTLIKEVLDNNLFIERWFISNDTVEKCKDCQFRYSCLSNSDLEKTKNGYKKIDTCNFNPYENSWTVDL